MTQMKKITLLMLCLFLAGLATTQGNDLRVKTASFGGAWLIVGSTEAARTTDHDAIIVKKEAVLNYKKMKVTVRNTALTITKMNVVYSNGEEETINIPLDIPKNGESQTVDVNSGIRTVKRIDFWYDKEDFTSGKAEVTIFGRK